MQKKLKVKTIEKEEKKKKNRRRKKEGKKKKRKTLQNCKSPMQMQRFVTTIKSVTEYAPMHIHP